MSTYEHNRRNKILNQAQHPFKHTLGDFEYSNSRLLNVTTLEDTLNYIIAFMYPNYQGTVATPANLPDAGTTAVNSYYIVTDDGDGNSAGYILSSIDGANTWIKRYDVDFNNDAILAETLLSTRAIYVHKYGVQDRDSGGSVFTGDLAGQRIYGSDTANEHLILYANSGDSGGGNTGYVQVGDNFRPLVDSTFDCGTDTYRWSTIYTDSLVSGTLVATSGSITDTSGAISFDDEDLSTTGTLSCGVLTASSGSGIGTLTLSDGSIIDSSGAISFGNENLSTTGTLASGITTISSDLILGAGSITSVSGAISFGDEDLSTTGTLNAGATTLSSLTLDDLSLDGNTISILTLDTNLNLAANGTGVINLQSAATTLGITATGTVGVTGQIDVDNLTLNGNDISSTDVNGNISFTPNGTGLVVVSSTLRSDTDNTDDLGSSSIRFANIYLANSIGDGTSTFLISELMALRSANWRDSGRTLAAQAGDGLFFDGTEWLASAPDSEIDHTTVSNLTTGDSGHTQFVMLTGRSGGQTVQGGTAASENLTLESTSNATKGDIFFSDDIVPTTDASFAVTWSGTDIGDATHNIRDVYSKGEFHGFRLENFVTAGLPASSASAKGRLVYDTDTNKIYVDTGSTLSEVGSGSKHLEDLAFNGTDTTKDVDVSANISDARTAIIQLLDNSNDYERVIASIKATSASNVRITTNLALPAGTYRLIVME